MANNTSLGRAKEEKNDEFYTQYNDIQKEINAYVEYNENIFKDKIVLLPCDDPEWSNFTKFFAQNFERFGLKKLISTSYAYDSKHVNMPYQLSLFEEKNKKFDKKKTKIKGKIFTLIRDINNDSKVDINDLEWNYLKGDGDFRSKEVLDLINESDIIVTNPPFSLFREFLSIIIEKEKDFLIIGNQNAITYKQVFPLLKDNLMWIGYNSGSQQFEVPNSNNTKNSYIADDGKKYAKFGNTRWFTNMEHGKRHEPIDLMTLNDNIKFSKHKNDAKWDNYNKKYDNYDAIEIPFVDAIPLDYDGVMGVPISFLDRYSPDQFEIIGRDGDLNLAVDYDFFTPPVEELKIKYKKANNTWRVQNAYIVEGDVATTIYKRLFIKKKGI